MTSYHLSPIIVDKNVNLAYAWVNLWLSVSNLLVWKTGERIVVGSSSIWTKIREHICVIRVFLCVFYNKSMEKQLQRELNSLAGTKLWLGIIGNRKHLWSEFYPQQSTKPMHIVPLANKSRGRFKQVWATILFLSWNGSNFLPRGSFLVASS